MEEIWKDVEDYEGIYQVSNLGRIKSLPRKYVTKERITYGITSSSTGYKQMYMRMPGGIEYNKTLHRLVAKAFIPNPNNYPVINHIDGVRTNNVYTNLEWCTYSHNSRHTHLIGRANLNPPRGEACNLAKLTYSDVLLIRKRIARGDRQINIARAFGVSKSTIYKIRINENWKHVV